MSSDTSKATHVQSIVVTDGRLNDVDLANVTQEIIKEYPEVERIDMKIIEKAK